MDPSTVLPESSWALASVRRFRWMLFVMGGLFLATECLALTGWIPQLEPLSFPEIAGNILFAIGFGCPVVLHLSSLPGWREITLTAAIGVLLTLLLGTMQGIGPPQTITGLGLASLGTLAWRTWHSTGFTRLRALQYLLPACVSLLFTFEAGIHFKLVSAVMPITFDPAAYTLDGALGAQFSFLVGQWFSEHPWLAGICFILYVAPPPSLVFVYALQVRARHPPPIDVVTVLLISAVIGYGLYFLYPVAGPLVAFPGAYPHSTPTLPEPNSYRMSVPFIQPNGEPAPRNGMPSLHFASVLLAYWHARPYGWWARGIAAIFLVGTFLATLGLGEHYFVDLVVALPFTLLIQAACTPHFARLREPRQRALLGSGLLLALWYGVLFAGVGLLAEAPILAWAITLATVSVVGWLENRLYRAALPEIRRAPGPRGSRIWGNLAEFRGDVLKLLCESRRDFGDVVRFRLGPNLIHLVAHPEHIKQVLVTSQSRYNKQTRSSAKIRGLTGEGLLTSSGDFWLAQRRLMQPAFQMARLASFMDLMTEATSEMLERWRAIPARTTLDIASEMMRLTYTIVAKALFGADVSHNLEEIERAAAVVMEHTYRRLERIVDFPLWFPTPANRRFRKALSAIDRVVSRIMASQRASPRHDAHLLSLLFQKRDEQTGLGMSERQLRNEMISLLMAGHETTANSLSWTWYLLSRHPQAAERIRSEASEVFQGSVPRFADLSRLKFTSMVFKESMRLYPSIWIMERHVLEEDCIAGFSIPAGSTVVISPYVTQRHPDFWRRPDEFIPDRFAAEQAASQVPYSYIPFGGGQRLCIGKDLATMEAQVIIPMVLQAFALRLAEGATIQPKPGITLRMRNGLPMEIQAVGS